MGYDMHVVAREAPVHSSHFCGGRKSSIRVHSVEAYQSTHGVLRHNNEEQVHGMATRTQESSRSKTRCHPAISFTGYIHRRLRLS